MISDMVFTPLNNADKNKILISVCEYFYLQIKFRMNIVCFWSTQRMLIYAFCHINLSPRQHHCDVFLISLANNLFPVLLYWCTW